MDRHVNLEAIESGRAGRAALPSLERIERLTAAMGDPQTGYPLVHVTGTNGKGSTVRITTALLLAKGLSVGTYSSPHLERLNERLAWNGEAISDEALGDLLLALRDLEPFVVSTATGSGDALGTAPTWFELMTAGAYRWFADVAVDAAVVEVGLGGRFDATNVADAAVAVVTNVDLDHVDILGATRAEIAAEKAGIIKRGSIVVMGEEDPALVSIFAAEAERAGAAGIWQRHEDFGCESNRLAVGGRLLDLRTPGARYEDVFLPLHGAHQGDNAAAALAAAEAFFGEPLGDDVVAEALAATTAPGRMEVVLRRPLVVLDGAHNAAGARAAGVTLAEDFALANRVIVVMGCLRGRDPGELLRGLIGPDGVGASRIDHVIGCPAPSPRSLPVEAVTDAARSLGLSAEGATTVGGALARARQMAMADDLVLVTGSLYVVGAARGALRGPNIA